MSRVRVPPEVRFWAKVNKTESCWLWTAAFDKDGYGLFRPDYRIVAQKRAHRYSYEQLKGSIPEGFVLDHLCHIPACVNPEHLRVVSSKQNREHTVGPQRTNRSGFLGVDFHAGKYRARVMSAGKRYEFGSFETAEDAGEAAKQGRLMLFSHNDRDRGTGA